jgi:hypothetical protein
MTIIPWPTGAKPRRTRAARKLIVDPLPQSVLNSLVSDLPGPQGETAPERAARFEAQLAEVLAFNPRDTADAMLATQCVLMRLLARDTHRDATRPGLTPMMLRKFMRNAREFDKLALDTQRTLADRQTRPLDKMDPEMFRSLGMENFLIPDPDDPEVAEEAFSAIIVPLHPAPKMLQ